MKIHKAPIGSTVKMNETEAIILSHGEMGCRVNVTKTPEEEDSLTKGPQVWSNLTKISLLKRAKPKNAN